MGSSNLNFLLFQWEVVIHLDHHHNMCIADCHYLFYTLEVSANRRKIYTMKNVMMYNIIRMIMSSYVLHIYTSLSIIVLNGRDWKEIILLPEK